MGSVKRPCCSSQWSLSCSSSRTVWAAKNSRVTRCLVSSQVTALAPFSQNSKELVCRGSGHAQPGQSKPSGWFIDNKALEPLSSTLCSRSALAVACRAPQPPAGAAYGANTGFSADPSSGVSAGGEGGKCCSLMSDALICAVLNNRALD